MSHSSCEVQLQMWSDVHVALYVLGACEAVLIRRNLHDQQSPANCIKIAAPSSAACCSEMCVLYHSLPLPTPPNVHRLPRTMSSM